MSQSTSTILLCEIEDWSGAGFHTKQPLNVGQPAVSQVVSSRNNQSCREGEGQTLSTLRAGVANSQARATFCCQVASRALQSFSVATFSWLDRPGFGAVKPPRSSRFLLMKIPVGHRLS